MTNKQPLLDATFLAKQRQTLLKDRATLSESLSRCMAEKSSIKQAAQNQSNESDDGAQDLSIEQNDQILAETLLKQKATIDRALAKMEEGTYGLSDVGGEAIPRARLEAFPEAIRTVEEEARRGKIFHS